MFAKLALLFFASSVFAHQSGHGPAINGVGPNGGKLASVILASQAEVGASAKAAGSAEFKVKGTSLLVTLLKTDNKTVAKIPTGKIKWILLPREGKPKVVEASSEADLVLSDKELSTMNAVELILPGFESSSEKHVVYLKL